MKRGLAFIFLIILIGFVSASLNVSLSDQGTNVKYKSNGSLVEGDLGVFIYNASTGGNLIYSETFSDVISNGSWNIMLGESSSNPLMLEYGKVYYKDYSINGEDLDFTDSYGNIMERRFFYSPLGDINSEDINSSADLTVNNLYSSNNVSAITGFFSFLGDLTSRITSLFVQNINFTGDINGTGNIETSGNVSADYFIGDGSQLTGIIGGNESWNETYADTLYAPIDSGNSSFNQTLTDTLYYSISNPENYINLTSLEDYYNKTQVDNNLSLYLLITDERYNETTLVLSVNSTENIQNLGFYNKTEIDNLLSSAGNSSFNQTLTDALYLGINDQKYNETVLILEVNSSLWDYINLNEGDWSSTYNSTYNTWAYNQTQPAIDYSDVINSTLSSRIDGISGGNSSFNQTLTDSLYIPQSEESNLDVNSSDYWDNLNSINSTQMGNYGGVLSITVEWLQSLFYYKSEVDSNIDGNRTEIYNSANSNYSNLTDYITSVTSGNESWNQSYADTLYYSISNPNNYLNETTGQIFNETSLIESVNNSLSNYNETDLINSVNTTENIQELYNSTAIQIAQQYGGNESFNQTLTDSLYIQQSEESNLNVNSSTWWNGISGWVTGYLIRNGINLDFNETKLNETIQSLATSNESFNQTLTDSLYAPNTTEGIQELYNSTAIQIAQEYAGNGSYTSSDLEYGYFTISVDQTSNLAVNNHVQFDTRLAGNINVSTGSGQSSGLITLHAGKKYRLYGKLGYATGSSFYINYQFYDYTNSVYSGKMGQVAASQGYMGFADLIIEPETDIQIGLRFQTVSGVCSTIDSRFASMVIEEIGSAVSVSSSSSSSTGDLEYGFFTLSADQTSNLAVNNHIQFDTRDAGNINISTGSGQDNGLITLHAGKRYKLEAQLYVSFGGAGGNQLRARFRKSDDSEYYGTWTYYNPVTTTGNDNSPAMTTAIIEPTEDIQVKLEMSNVGTITAVRYNQGTYLMIEEIASSTSSSSNSSGVPEGAIMAFNLAECPTGWVLADGSSGTPDLRGIFLRGSGTSSVLQYANGSYFHSTYGTYGNDSFQGHSIQMWGTYYSRWDYPIYGANHGTTGGNYETLTFTSNSSLYPKIANNGINGDPRTGAETTPAYYSAIYCVKTGEDSATSNSIWGESGNDIVQNNASQNVVLNNNLTVGGLLKSSNGNYSTEEVKTGQIWIDGKPVYRKVIDCGTTVNGYTTTPHNISNMDLSSLRFYVMVYRTGTSIQDFPIAVSGGAVQAVPQINTANVYIYSTNTFWTVKVILEYTKTTD